MRQMTLAAGSQRRCCAELGGAGARLGGAQSVPLGFEPASHPVLKAGLVLTGPVGLFLVARIPACRFVLFFAKEAHFPQVIEQK